MSNLPKADMILAGFLAQFSLWIGIVQMTGYKYTEENALPGWMDSDLCLVTPTSWTLLTLTSLGVAIITIVKSEKEKAVKGIIAFFASFLLNFGGNSLGFMTFFCSIYNRNEQSNYNWQDKIDLHNQISVTYTYCSIPILMLASIGIFLHYLKKIPHPQPTNVPDPEVILLGVCVHFTAWDIIYSSRSYYDMCKDSGIRSWLLILVLSGILTVLTYKTTANHSRASRSVVTFIGTFLLQLILGGTGSIALECAEGSGITRSDAYRYFILVLNAVIAVIILLRFVASDPVLPQPPEMEEQNTEAHAAPSQPVDPDFILQPTYPTPAWASTSTSPFYSPQTSNPAPPPPYPPQSQEPYSAPPPYSEHKSYPPKLSSPPPKIMSLSSSSASLSSEHTSHCTGRSLDVKRPQERNCDNIVDGGLLSDACSFSSGTEMSISSRSGDF